MPSAAPASFRLARSRRAGRVADAGHALAALAWLAAGVPGLPLLAGVLIVLASAIVTRRRPSARRLATDGAGRWSVDCGGRVLAGACRARLLPGAISITFRGPEGGSVLLFHDAFRDADHTRARLLLRHGPPGPAC